MYDTLANNSRNQLRAIIENFDAHYDVHQMYAGVLPYLEKEPDPAKPHVEETNDLELYVGCAWARIVAWDVQYNLVKGQAALQQSRAAAEELRARLHKFQISKAPFPFYVTARWFDAAAKLLYRCGDHTLGRMYFTIANGIVEEQSNDLWYCRADIWSDYQRNTFEEQRQAGTIKGPQELFQRFVDKIIVEIGTLGARLSQDMAKVAVLSFDHLTRDYLEDFAQRATKESVRSREALRGICNLLHNASSIDPGTPDGLERRLQLSEASARIAEMMGDEYRRGQALFQQAQLYGRVALDDVAAVAKNRGVDLAKALRIYADIRDNLAASRQKLMCRQQIAIAEANLFLLLERAREATGADSPGRAILSLIGGAESQLEGSVRQLFRLIDDIQAIFQVQGNVQGLDIDLHKFTVDAAAKLFRELRKRLGDCDVCKALQKRLRQEQIQMIRGTKKVVKVGTYKHAHSRMIEPIFKEMINAEVAAMRYPEALAWIEEATSRELLDLLSSQHAPVESLDNRREPAGENVTPQDATRKDDPERDLRDEPVRVANSVGVEIDEAGEGHQQVAVMTRSLRSSGWNEMKNAIESSLLRFDEHCLARPIDTCEQDPDVWSKLNDVAQKSKHAVIRYFEIEKGKYVAFVFGGEGTPHFVPNLDATKTLFGFEALLKSYQSPPPPTGIRVDDRLALAAWQDACANRLKELAELIGAELVQPVMEFVDHSATNLCFIPSHELFRLPLHLGLTNPNENRSCIGLQLPCYYATGGAALVRLERQRRLTATRGPKDVLGVIGTRNLDDQGNEFEAFGTEALKAEWDTATTFVAGPVSLCKAKPSTWLGTASFDGIRKLLEKQPQVLLFSGHGNFAEINQETHAYLMMDEGEIITPYDWAGLRLERNHLVILSACLSGQGTNKGGGEVSGFLRGVMAAGAGAVAVTTWPIKDRVARDANRRILEQLKPAHGVRVDLPRLFHKLWKANAAASDFYEYGCYNLYV